MPAILLLRSRDHSVHHRVSETGSSLDIDVLSERNETWLVYPGDHRFRVRKVAISSLAPHVRVS